MFFFFGQCWGLNPGNLVCQDSISELHLTSSLHLYIVDFSLWNRISPHITVTAPAHQPLSTHNCYVYGDNCSDLNYPRHDCLYRPYKELLPFWIKYYIKGKITNYFMTRKMSAHVLNKEDTGEVKGRKWEWVTCEDYWTVAGRLLFLQ
jgi:hypothetical protein